MADMTARNANDALAKFRAGAEQWQREQIDVQQPESTLAAYERFQRAADANELAHQIAHETSRTDIECMCQPAGDFSADPRYWNTADPIADDDRIYVDRAVLYLDLTGLLDRHPDNPAHVHIRAREEGDAS